MRPISPEGFMIPARLPTSSEEPTEDVSLSDAHSPHIDWLVYAVTARFAASANQPKTAP
jgi:hypothetical protein